MGNRPVTLCTCQWADLPFDELCALASKMGYDGLEVACWGNGIDIDRAYSDDSYVAWIKETLAKNNLICKALACHIIGQCVGDAPDPRLNNFAPAALADKPEEIRAWAIDTMKKAPWWPRSWAAMWSRASPALPSGSGCIPSPRPPRRWSRTATTRSCACGPLS